MSFATFSESYDLQQSLFSCPSLQLQFFFSASMSILLYSHCSFNTCFLHSLKIKKNKKCHSYENKIVDLVFDWLIVGFRLLVVDELTDGKIVLLCHLIEKDDAEIV